MLELFLLVMFAAGLGAFVKKRGGTSWIWVVIFVVVYYSQAILLTMLLGRGASYIAVVVVAGVMFAGIFLLVGGGRRLRESWQCPECQFFNDPTTLRCDCGYRLP